MEDDGDFLLDAPEYSEEAWEERPKCNWSWPPVFSFGKVRPGYTCYSQPRWRFLTTYSNASKTDTSYCHHHGMMFHEGVYTWTLIDHNTKAATTVIDLDINQVCICTDGHECPTLEEFRMSRARLEGHVLRALGALEFWD